MSTQKSIFSSLIGEKRYSLANGGGIPLFRKLRASSEARNGLLIYLSVQRLDAAGEIEQQHR